MIILLDNGHGVNTPGKRSPMWDDETQLLEFEFNRDIVSRIAKKLNDLDIKYEIIVPEESDIPLLTRVVRINAICSRNKLEKYVLLSIHANAGGGTGWEAYTSPGQTLSDKYAELLYASANDALEGFAIRKEYADRDSDKEARFYILERTKCPAILTENLFMDTEKDCKFIMSDKGRDIIASLHVDAITKFNTIK